jgi:hypothetical protein
MRTPLRSYHKSIEMLAKMQIGVEEYSAFVFPDRSLMVAAEPTSPIPALTLVGDYPEADRFVTAAQASNEF